MKKNNFQAPKETSNPRISFSIPVFWILLTILFIILKLTKVIAWSWLWILCPLWIPVGIGMLFVSIIFIAITVISKMIIKV